MQKVLQHFIYFNNSFKRNFIVFFFEISFQIQFWDQIMFFKMCVKEI